MKSIFHGAGYFKNDDRASGGKLDEDDILGCKHCHKPIKKHEWLKDGWRCQMCDAPLCELCAKAPPSLKCAGPFELQLEKQIQDAYRREQNAKILGV